MYHKLQLVGYPEFIPRHEEWVAGKRGKREKWTEKKRLIGTRMTGWTGSMGFIKTEAQRDRVMYHKLQLVGCPEFIPRHEEWVAGKRGKREKWTEKKRLIGTRMNRMDRDQWDL